MQETTAGFFLLCEGKMTTFFLTFCSLMFFFGFVFSPFNFSFITIYDPQLPFHFHISEFQLNFL